MSTLFSRRPGKGSRLGFGSSGSSSKHNKYGAGISNTDLLAASEDVSHPSSYGTTDTRALSPLPLNQQPPSNSPRNGDHQSMPSMYEHAADDFGRMTPTQTKPKSGPSLTLPQLHKPSKSPNNSSHTLTRVSSPQGPMSPSRILSPGPPVARPAPPNAPQGEEAFPYGYTHAEWDIEITQSVAVQVVEICGQEIRARGLSSPLIFSSMALDLSAGGVTALIRCFAGCDHTDLWQSSFVQEAKYANVHNLAAMIKWTLARLGRFYAVPVPSQTPSKKGEVHEEVAIVQQRGWLDLETYMSWRDQEQAAGHPYTAFSHFCANIDDEAAQLLRSLFSLLSSTTSYSHTTGMTPSKLARLFGVLLFGLPEDETFSRTYDAYVRAANATEHLLLAHIRNLAAFEVLPIRLMNHVTGYPSMLSADVTKLPSHLKAVPVTQVERLVRLYSSDLIQTACELELLTQSREWAACCSSNEHHGKDPQLTDRFRKLINLRGGGRQGRRAKTARDGLSPEPSLRGHSSRSANKTDDPASYSSVAQEEWGNFSFEGFSETDPSKLTFDLRESERSARTKKRDSVGWNEFANIGFGDRDNSFTDVLNFDGGLKEDIERWPGEKAELLAKLHQNTVKLPPFPYDSNPKVVAHACDEERFVNYATGDGMLNRIDETFAEVWADYLIGNGWSNRDELTHRAANFVVVQYKSRQTPYTVGSQDAGSSRATSAVVPSLTAAGDAIPADDRVDASWFIIQEIVPSGYRADLEASGKVKSRSRPSIRKLNVFRKLRRDKSTSSSDPAAPPPPAKEDPDKLFPPGTKKRFLSRDPATMPDPTEALDRNGSTSTKRGGMSSLFGSPLLSHEEDQRSGSSPVLGADGGRNFITTLREKTLRNRKPSAGASAAEEATTARGSKLRGKSDKSDKQQALGLLGAEYAQNGGFKNSMRDDSFGSSDFEVRSLHDPDDAIASESHLPKKRSLLRHNRTESRDDAWIDIMTRTKNRMQDQDAPPPRSPAVRAPAGSNGVSHPPTSSTVQDAVDEPAAQTGASSTSVYPRDASDEGDNEPVDDAITPVASPIIQDATVTVVAPSTDEELHRGPKVAVADESAGHEPKIVTPTEIDPEAAFVAREPSPQRDDLLVTPRKTTSGAPDRATPSPSRSQRSGLSASSLRSREGDPHYRESSGSLSPSPRPQDLDAFPQPPTDIPSTEEQISFSTSPKLPVRSVLKPVSDTSSSAADSAREARVSAAVLRARELRAKLQPVDGRAATGGDAANANTSTQASSTGSANNSIGGETSPQGMRKTSDPFAKNPTSGKVASIAARFGVRDEVPAAPRKAPSSSSPRASPAKMLNSLTPPQRQGDRRGTPERSAPSSPSLAPVGSAGEERHALTKAALETLPSGMMHPDMPPSPRQSDYVLGDGESLAPDDAASNYSRSTEESSDPATTIGGNRGIWDGKSQAQHDSQQAFQNALLRHQEGPSAASGEGEEQFQEELQDEVEALPRRFAEPYQPGQPLDNVFEESESMLSGSNM